MEDATIHRVNVRVYIDNPIHMESSGTLLVNTECRLYMQKLIDIHCSHKQTCMQVT